VRIPAEFRSGAAYPSNLHAAWIVSVASRAAGATCHRTKRQFEPSPAAKHFRNTSIDFQPVFKLIQGKEYCEHNK
jgi:hypothetical protein